MENEEKGCVYFFKHIGLTPIKIGYSNNESPIDRFNSFKTFAPYGAELLGFIRHDNPKELESILHDRFSQNRLSGEWFEITQPDVEKVVSLYSNIEDVKEKNKFQIEWAKRIDEKSNIENNVDFLPFLETYCTNKRDDYKGSVVMNQSELMKELQMPRENILTIIKYFKLQIKSYRVDGKVKSGYLLYKK